MSVYGSYETEYEYEFEDEYGETPLQEWELAGESEQGEAEYETAYEYEADEYELTHELLAVRNEAELDRFLGKLVKSAGTFLNSGVGKAVGGVLKNVAKTALPAVGAALGTALLPGAGTAIGGQLGSLAGGLLEVGEAEVMSEDEAEFEAARRFVDFGRATSRNAGLASPRVPPKTVARAAAVAAARRHAPGLLRPRPQPSRGRREPGRPRPQVDSGRRRPSRSDGGRPRRRPVESDGGQPRRRPRRPGPWPPVPWQPVPWQAVPWPPGQWQPSDAWAGWPGGPDGRSSGNAPGDTGGRGPDPADDAPAPGPGSGAADDGGGDGGGDDGESSGFEFE